MGRRRHATRARRPRSGPRCSVAPLALLHLIGFAEPFGPSRRRVVGHRHPGDRLPARVDARDHPPTGRTGFLVDPTSTVRSRRSRRGFPSLAPALPRRRRGSASPQRGWWRTTGARIFRRFVGRVRRASRLTNAYRADRRTRRWPRRAASVGRRAACCRRSTARSARTLALVVFGNHERLGQLGDHARGIVQIQSIAPMA